MLLDAVYSPVTRVRYTTENTRVGQKTNYDKLILEIWTNGTILAGNGIWLKPQRFYENM